MKRVLRVSLGAACALALMVVLPGLDSFSAKSECGEDVDLQIMPDKRVYTVGTTAQIKFLIINKGDTSLFLFKNINQCSSPLGWLSLRVRGPHNATFPGLECAVDYLMDEFDPAQTLSDSNYAVVLRKREIFGKWQEYKLPKEKGLYRLQAEIGQVGVLNDDQETKLSEKHMRILRHTCLSSPVTIEIK
jgi:hypothetical protein